jgi:hypothetical protein
MTEIKRVPAVALEEATIQAGSGAKVGNVHCTDPSIE